jgi:hypothetical protein
MNSPQKNTTPTNCLNCGTELKGNYCYFCGQKNKTYQITLKQLFLDFLGDYLTFDSKFFRSIKPLLFKPGFLTNEYIAGRRVQYILPLRLYLFVSLIFFFILAINPHKAKMIQFSADPVVLSDSTIVADSSSKKKDSTFVFFGDISKKDTTHNIETADSTNQQPDRNVTKIAEKIKTAEENQNQARQNFVGFLPKMFFLMLPVFALILKMLYARRKIFYVRHFIFSLHFHSFTFITFGLLFIILGFFENPESQFLPGIVVILNSLYLITAMKKVYKQSLIKTVFKFLLLSFNYVIVMAVSTLTVLGISIYLLN